MLTAWSQGRGGWLGIKLNHIANDTIYHAYVMNPNKNSIKTQCNFQVGKHTDVLVGGHILIPQGKDIEALCSGPSQTSVLLVWS